ncbi:Signal recognition particle protein [Candidatus Xenohaliotis californiensis]|uniref:signal-recognition-particle GTPase n=1 Tax=Candidatus Xenohaliotis californiensis TaxID=84677 RepID=A0ABP0ERS4_9RICK|nr:Signal recognition particle protein [Candidatus Xenohaliotis californiensis]
MFDGLSNKFTDLFNNILGSKHISKKDVEKALNIIRESLIDADVAPSVIDVISDRIGKICLGDKVLKSLDPTKMIIKATNDVLIDILGGALEANAELYLDNVPSVIMMVGLQGAGKTTSTAKLALHLRERRKKKVLVASLDIYRPAAQEQLKIIAQQNNIDSLEIISNENPLEITSRAIKKSAGYDVLILDTAGRLHVDESLIKELVQVKKFAKPSETILVADAMLGQDALYIAEKFNNDVGLTGVMATRVDGDARGGAIISMKYITGCSIKFVGTGEKAKDLEQFHPERAASKILGMGDIVSVVEKAQEQIEEEDMMRMVKRVQKGLFNFNDMLRYYNMIGKMGGLRSLLGYLPMMGGLKDNLSGFDDSTIKKDKAIISSMTPAERQFPKLLNIVSRKLRISKGAGVKTHDIGAIVKRQQQIQKVFAKLKNVDMNNLGMDMNALNNIDMQSIMSMLKK